MTIGQHGLKSSSQNEETNSSQYPYSKALRANNNNIDWFRAMQNRSFEDSDYYNYYKVVEFMFSKITKPDLGGSFKNVHTKDGSIFVSKAQDGGQQGITLRGAGGQHKPEDTTHLQIR